MTLADLAGRRIVLWGTGREAMAAAALIRRHLPDQAMTFIDDRPDAMAANDYGPVVTVPDAIETALAEADIVIKSPGVSLYHPRIRALQARGVPVTSLLNLWFALPRRARTVCVTGTKGKSTTAALIAHLLRGLGQRVLLAGNIGQAAGLEEADADFAVVEMSSYQTADFAQRCDLAVLTSLYPEHLDWHGTLDRYYADKLNLLAHADARLVAAQCLATMTAMGVDLPVTAVHDRALPGLTNAYLARPHNQHNVGMALAAYRATRFRGGPGAAAARRFQRPAPPAAGTWEQVRHPVCR